MGPRWRPKCLRFQPGNLQNFSQPARISVSSDLFDQKPVVISMTTFMRVYDGSREKATSGRAQQAIVGDVSESTRAWVKNALPGLAWDSSSVAINSLVQPSFYAISALVETVAIERGSMPCVRLNYKGARMIVMVRGEELRSSMVQVMSVEARSYPDMFRLVRHMSRANIDN